MTILSKKREETRINKFIIENDIETGMEVTKTLLMSSVGGNMPIDWVKLS